MNDGNSATAAVSAGPARQSSDPPATVALAAQLISRPSLTPDDAGCQALLAQRLAAVGFTCETIVAGGVTNLWARRGTVQPLVCYAGHTDVVPTGPREHWRRDPFAAVVEDGWLHGRGAADMKGSLAAAVTAVERLLARRPDLPGALAFLLTSDEEGPSVDGTVRVVEALEARGTAIDYCVVGEPTAVAQLGDTIKTGRRGSLSGTLTVRGVQGHVAYPDLAVNPIHRAAPALAELAGTVWDDGEPPFPPTTFQCSNIAAGTGALNVIPGTLAVMFNFRFSTASTRESLAARVHAILARHDLDYALEWTGYSAPYFTPAGTLVDAAREAIRATVGVACELSCSGGTSDGRFIARICPQVVELGPVNATIHKVDEHIALADLVALSAIYERLFERLLDPRTA
jgi:succinyl-diaminopimelate desuccinylase